MNLQSEVIVIFVHDRTLHQSCSIFELLERHSSIGCVFDEVVASAHVAVHIVELEQGVRTVVEIGIVTCGNGIPLLGGSSTGADLVAAVGAVLHSNHIVQLKIIASKCCSISGSGCQQFAFARYSVVVQITSEGQIGTSQARVRTFEWNHPIDGVQEAAAVELVTTILNDVSHSFSIHQA